MASNYFTWLYDLVCGKRYSKSVSYKKLLRYLYDTEFTWLIPMDRNRAEDGIGLRDRYPGNPPSGPCNVLEMMVMLSIRCEENIMDDALLGDRTGQWFWNMIVNMGLGGMYDSRFDLELVEKKVDDFINREYEPDGRGGLFTIRNCDRDMRDMEIWQQMCWYISSTT